MAPLQVAAMWGWAQVCKGSRKHRFKPELERSIVWPGVPQLGIPLLPNHMPGLCHTMSGLPKGFSPHHCLLGCL